MITTLLLSYLGFAVGIILSRIAEEEIKPAEKIFQVLQQGLFLGAMVIAAGVFYFQNRYALMALPIVFVVLHFIFKIKNYISSMVLHYVFFTVLYLAIFISTTTEWSILLPIIVFLYGFPSGSLLMLYNH